MQRTTMYSLDSSAPLAATYAATPREAHITNTCVSQYFCDTPTNLRGTLISHQNTNSRQVREGKGEKEKHKK
jgi:hypothetical protein